MRAGAWLSAAALSAAALSAGCSIDEKVPLVDAGMDGPPVEVPPDGEAPETKLDASPDAFSRFGASTFRFSSTDPAATFECSVDGETPVACQSPYTRTLADGTHTFSVRAIDRAGNSDATPAERAWTIDTAAPDTTIQMAPPSADNSSMVSFSFRSSETSSAFECSLDNSPYQACASGASFGPLTDGTHSFAVRAKDRAGNVDASPAIHAWLVDTSTPDTVLLSGPTGATASAAATFTFLSPDAGSGATFQCSLDGAVFGPCTSPREVTNLPAGAHTFRVRVRDSVGNLDPTPASRAWTVDLTPPATTIAAGPEGVVPLATASFTFTSNEADATFECALDGAAFSACASPFAAAELAQGGHSFSVRAVDLAGHLDPTPATRAWTVDTVPPDVAITAGPAAGGASGPRVVFAFSAESPACSLDGAAFTACASPVAFSLPAGPHQLRIRATDPAGNTTTETRSWTVVCAPPSEAGAAALLHLDEAGQVLANAVPGGAPATLGDTDASEFSDPDPAAGRFGGGLSFSAIQGDRAAWPLALGALPALSLELWASPEAASGTRDLFTSGDGRLTVRSARVNGSTVRLSAVVQGADGEAFVATSGNVAQGAWHHVLVSLQEPVLRLWVDGAPAQVEGVVLGAPLDLGAALLGGTYEGLLDEVWLSGAVIADTEAALGRYCPL